MDCCASHGPAALPLDEAVARIGRLYGPVTGIEQVSLRDAAGRILGEAVTAPFNVPPVAVSAMDGWGFAAAPLDGNGRSQPETRPADTRRLRVVGRVPAGGLLKGTVGPGEAVRIFTGAPVPPGVDTIAMQEDCCAADDVVTVPTALTRGANIRPAGEDMQAGSVVLPVGRRLRPQEVGLAAAAGRATLGVHKRLRVVLFSTGDELHEPGTPKPPHAIHDANRHMLRALLEGLGAEVSDLGILPDSPGRIRSALGEAAPFADLLVTSGGVSVGEEDHVKGVVRDLGAIDLWRLRIKPGKPVAFGRVGNTPFLGLPGNPVSAMVTFLLVGRPLVLRLSGAEQSAVPRGLALAGFSLTRKPGRREFLRARLTVDAEGRPVAVRFPSDSSGVITSLVESYGLIDLPEATENIREGDPVTFLPFTGLAG